MLCLWWLKHTPMNPVNWSSFLRPLTSCGSCSQDILRLLTLWFNHGAATDVQAALQEGFQQLNIDTWLVVIPQIIARIHSPVPAVRNLIQALLTRVGRHHPQVPSETFETIQSFCSKTVFCGLNLAQILSALNQK